VISTRFIKSSLLITIGNALPLLSGIVLLPFYINVLSPELFAELAIYISITLLAQIVFGFGLEAYMIVAPIKLKDDAKLQSVGISTLFTSTLFFGILLILISYFYGTKIFSIIFDNGFNFFPFGFLSIITAFFNNFFKFYNNLLLSQQKLNEYFTANVINFFATLIISLIGLYMYQNSLWGPIFGRFYSGVIIFLLSFIGFIRYYKIKFSTAFFFFFLKFSIPMFVFFVFNWAMNYFDRFIIENNMPLTELAVYDFATKCTLPLEFLQNGLFAAITPIIFKIWRDNNLTESTQEVNRYFNGYSALFLILVPLSCIVIPFIVPLIIYKTVYFDSFKYIGILAVGYCFKAYYYIYYIVVLYHNKTKIMPVVYLILASIQVALMYLSVSYFGIMGIILSSVFVKMIQPLIMALFTKDIFKFQFNKLKIIYLPMAFLVLVLASQIFINAMPYVLFYILQFMIMSILVYLVYKNELVFVAKKYLTKKKISS